ncbi:MAG: NUDIX hydrolase [Chloroflexota bacterium]
MEEKIRPLAICLFRRGERILVMEGYDPTKRERFFRPLGGGIEFGERGWETVQRELREEIQAEAQDIRYLFTLENIFTFNGQRGHEIVLVYDGSLGDESLYEREVIEGTEYDPFCKTPMRARWMRADEFGKGGAILYPIGLLERL